MRFSSALIRRRSCKSGMGVQKRCTEMRGQGCKRNNGRWGLADCPKIGRISWYAKVSRGGHFHWHLGLELIEILGPCSWPDSARQQHLTFFCDTSLHRHRGYFLLEKKGLDGFNQDEQAPVERTAPAWNAGQGRNWPQGAKQPNPHQLQIKHKATVEFRQQIGPEVNGKELS